MSRLSRSEWCPQLRQGYVIAPAVDGGWQVRWDFDEVAFLDGKSWGLVLPWLIPLLNGKHTFSEMEGLARQRNLVPELGEVMRQLDSQEFLVPDTAHRDEAVDDPRLLACPPALLVRPPFTHPISCLPIAVLGRCALAEEVARTLAIEQFQVHSVDAWTGEFPKQNATHLFPVVIETDWRPDELEEMNRRAIALRQPWLLLGAWASRTLVGPLFIPGETACYVCYRRRLDSHRRYREAYEILDKWRRSEASPAHPEPIAPAIATLASAWTALELVAYLRGPILPRTLGRVLVYYPLETRLTTETVLRMPWCTACSAARP